MPIAAWDVYKRGQDAMQHMQALADVSQFPADGAQKWAELEQNIKAIDEQVRKLKATSRKGPAFQESWNRWLACGPQLDAMAHHVGEWKQGLEELSDHEDKEMDWELKARNKPTCSSPGPMARIFRQPSTGLRGFRPPLPSTTVVRI